MSETLPGKERPKARQRPITEIIADLSKPIQQKHLQKKSMKGSSITFLSWYAACNYLDYYAPGWNYSVIGVHPGIKAGDVALHVRLTIPALEGDFSRDAMALELYDPKMYGDAYTNAESAALRRAAAKFGLGRGLYEKDG